MIDDYFPVSAVLVCIKKGGKEDIPLLYMEKKVSCLVAHMKRVTERCEINHCPGIWVNEGFANKGKRTWFQGCDKGYSAIAKCAAYEDLEEKGLLKIIPCKPNDTAWIMSEKEIEIIDLMCQCNMNVLRVAKKMHYHRNTIMYYLQKIKRKYNLDPQCFFDLIELKKLADAERMDLEK